MGRLYQLILVQVHADAVPAGSCRLLLQIISTPGLKETDYALFLHSLKLSYHGVLPH